MLAEKAARKFLHEQGVREIVNPVQELLDVTAEARGLYEFLRDHVAQLDVMSWEHLDAKGALQIKGIIEAMERAMDRTQKFLAEVVRLGLEERLVAVSEVHVQAMVDAFDRTLSQSGLTLEAQALIRETMRRELGKDES